MIFVRVHQQCAVMVAVRMTQFCGRTRNLFIDKERKENDNFRRIFLSLETKCSKFLVNNSQVRNLHVWLLLIHSRYLAMTLFLLPFRIQCSALFFNLSSLACMRVGNFHCRTNLIRLRAYSRWTRQTNKLMYFVAIGNRVSSHSYDFVAN